MSKEYNVHERVDTAFGETVFRALVMNETTLAVAADAVMLKAAGQ